jgi:hypothetical protein
VTSGSNQTFTITANSGYQVSNVVVDSTTSLGAVTTYTFQNVTAAHSISATFAAVTSQLIADAGPDQTVAVGATVTLNGTGSSDVGGPGIIQCYWTQTGGQQVTLPNHYGYTPTFRASVQSGQALTFKLTVTDKNYKTATDTCIVNVTSGSSSSAPSAKAGADQTVSEATIVTLNGSESTDENGAVSSYAWKQIDGPAVALSAADSPTPTFVAPDVASGAASLGFELTVTNNEGLKSRARSLVNVTQTDEPPTASTGPSTTARAGSTVKLAGSGSASSGDAVASLRWHQISGTPVTLSNPTSATPVFKAGKVAQEGNPLTFGLTVVDKNGLRSSATQVITVE